MEKHCQAFSLSTLIERSAMISAIQLLLNSEIICDRLIDSNPSPSRFSSKLIVSFT